MLGLQVQLVQWKLNLQPCRCCLCPPKRFSLWLLGQFWGSLAIKEDKFGLFGSLDTSNQTKNNHLTPIWSQIQMYFDNSLCISSPHWDMIGSKNKYGWIRLQTGVKWLFLLRFEFSKDQKRSKKTKNVFLYCQRSSKVPQQSSKNICCGVVSHLNVYIHLAYYNRYKCLETPQLHLLGKDILSQKSNLTFIM